MANFTRYNFTAGDQVELPLILSHYSTTPLAQSRIAWQTSDGQSGVLPLATVPDAGAVAPEGTLAFHAPDVQSPTPEFLRLQLISATGETLAENRYRYAAYPQITGAGSVTIHDPLNQLQKLRAALTAHGITVTDDSANTSAVWLSSALDDATTARLAQGAKVLLLADNHTALPPTNTLKIVPRAGSDLTGDWVSNFNWALTSSDLFKPLSPVIEDSILGWEAASITPDYVIEGLPQPEAAKAQAGAFYGWLNSNAAYLAEIPQDHGHLLLTTFRFDQYGDDPFATLLLNQLINH
jgi:hypothetical protein